jgi:hypothetical protein
MAGEGIPDRGSKRRIFLSRSPESTAAGWGITPQTLASNPVILNVLDGSGGIYPCDQTLLDNADSARGQGVQVSTRVKGPINIAADSLIETWLSPDILDTLCSMLMGAQTVALIGYTTNAYQHTNLWDNDQIPKPHTMQEHSRGPAAAYAEKYIGTFCNQIKISGKRGNQFCRLAWEPIGSRMTGADDMTAADITANLPLCVGLAPTKVGFQVLPIQAGVSAFDGDITVPSNMGKPVFDLTGGTPIELSDYAESWELRINGNVNKDELYRCGASATAGIYRTDPRIVEPTVEFDCTFEVNQITDDIASYFQQFYESEQNGFTFNMSGVSDIGVGDGTPAVYHSFAVIANNMWIKSIRKSRSLGKVMATVTFFAGAPAYNADDDIATWFRLWTWDNVSTNRAGEVSE